MLVEFVRCDDVTVIVEILIKVWLVPGTDQVLKRELIFPGIYFLNSQSYSHPLTYYAVWYLEEAGRHRTHRSVLSRASPLIHTYRQCSTE